MKVRNNYSNRKMFKHDMFEQNGMVSETVPDMSISLKDMIRDFTRGISHDVRRNPIFNNPDEFEDVVDSQIIDDELTHNDGIREEIETLHKSAKERREQAKASRQSGDAATRRTKDDEELNRHDDDDEQQPDPANDAQGKRSASEVRKDYVPKGGRHL